MYACTVEVVNGSHSLTMYLQTVNVNVTAKYINKFLNFVLLKPILYIQAI